MQFCIEDGALSRFKALPAFGVAAAEQQRMSFRNLRAHLLRAEVPGLPVPGERFVQPSIALQAQRAARHAQLGVVGSESQCPLVRRECFADSILILERCTESEEG